MEERCIADGCNKPSEKDRKYCHGHRKREKQRKSIEDTPLRAWGTPADKHLDLKALEYANAKDDGEEAFRLAWKRLKCAAMAYARKAMRQKVPNPTKTTSRG